MTGEKYVFRVKAVNAAGISQFSQESEAVEVKAAIGELNWGKLMQESEELYFILFKCKQIPLIMVKNQLLVF